MHQGENMMGVGAQGNGRIPDVGMLPMEHAARRKTLVVAAHEGRRTVLALVSASIISLVIWGLVVVLNVH